MSCFCLHLTCVALLLDLCEGPKAMLTLDEDCVSVVFPPSAADSPEMTRPLEKLRFPNKRLSVDEEDETCGEDKEASGLALTRWHFSAVGRRRCARTWLERCWCCAVWSCELMPPAPECLGTWGHQTERSSRQVKYQCVIFRIERTNVPMHYYNTNIYIYTCNLKCCHLMSLFLHPNLQILHMKTVV